MATRVAIISIAVENQDSVKELNRILHEYGEYIIGRMGIPYPKRGVSLISVVMDAPADIISAMTGKVGMLSGVTSKALYAKL
ncbi:MAG: iron-only hydrogenase system regulator [Eubacterium sp.]|jgi:putative iron-only hydrogenase system regulator|nr:iron-only hydrogenase system regulator [Eubacterium sp.]NBI85316.1 iron-only hydrogenase system regulator [Lachnospiraceae bacterium]